MARKWISPSQLRGTVSFLPQPPGDFTAGRGSLLLGALFLGLGVAVLLLQHKWSEGGFWICLGVFFLCYGAISLDWRRIPRQVLLSIGMVAGIAALGLAIMISI